MKSTRGLNRRIDEDSADEPRRTVCIERIEPGVRHTGVRRVRILRDEDSSRRRRRP